MGALTFFARLFFKLREKSINAFIQSPIKDQREILKSLLKKEGTQIMVKNLILVESILTKNILLLFQ